MCDVDYGERSDVWSETRQKARKQYGCVCCDRPIVKGEQYIRIGSLFDGHWSTTVCHISCSDITKFIAFQVCNQSMYFLEGGYTLRQNVREHMTEDPRVLPMYRDHLRERNRAEAPLEEP